MCINPRKRWNEKKLRYDITPCGYCYQCIRKRKLEWEVRLSYAVKWADCSFFKLLTFDPEHYPQDDHDKDFLIDQLQKFVKRLRSRLVRSFGSKLELKYFIVSEYGEEKDRLHYHCLFFIKGAKFNWMDFNGICRSCWDYGIVGNCFPVQTKNIRYCCKYIQKQYNFKLFSRFPLKDLRPSLPSELQESGYDYSCIDNIPKLPYAGKLVPVPNWWLKKIYGNKTSHTYLYHDGKVWTTKTIPYYVLPDKFRDINILASSINEQKDTDLLDKQCRFENKEGKDMKNQNYKHYDARKGLESNENFYE